MIDNEYFKEKLIRLREETNLALIKTKKSTQPVELDQSMMGRLSRMDAMQQREMYLAAERNHNQTLHNISAALKKIECKDFGFCSNCDEEISFKRLDLNPTVCLCIDCANN